MKREKLVTAGTGFALACLLTFGAMGAMISGLALPVVDDGRMYGIWLLGAALGAVSFSFKRGWLTAIPAAVVCFGYIWNYSDHFLALITRLASFYNSAYGWGVPEFAGINWREYPADMPLTVWGCLLAMTTAAGVVGGRRVSLTVLLALVPVGSTVVVTNTPPDSPYLFAVMLAVLVLVLTSAVRYRNPHPGARLALLTALPVGLVLGALFLACPQERYVNKSEEYLDRVVSWGQRLISGSLDGPGLTGQISGGPSAGVTANLSRVGPRNTWAYAVMDVKADFSGTVYLRGQDYDRYDGASWTAEKSRTETFGGVTRYGRWTDRGDLTVRTRGTANVLYLPYHPADAQALSGGRLENSGRLREYTFGVRTLMTPELEISHSFADTDFNASVYTALPSDTRRWAVEYLRNHVGPHTNDAQTARAIADHVRDSALYDKNTPRMDREYDDFVRWFLEESDTGYCVHFASAAAVLLRAAGIPARYVEGYMFRAEADRTVEVTADQAHAWVEYYNEELGAWIVLESTPADLTEEETEAAPPDTEPAARPTEPEPTRPDGPETQPLRPGDPGEGEKHGPDLRALGTVLKWLILPAGVFLGLEGQYRLRRSLRRRGGRPNARALAKWQDVELLCRFTRQQPPAALKDLAEKAKFSQHTLNAEELERFDAWLRQQRGALEKKPWYVRFACRYVLALW